MSHMSTQTIVLIAAGAAALVLWYKGYFDQLLSGFSFSSVKLPHLPASGDDLFLRAVKQAHKEAEEKALRDTADRMKAEVQAAVAANFAAAGANTPPASPPANPTA